MFVFGGFNGFVLRDSMVYSPGTCRLIAAREECLATRQGIKCVWTPEKLGGGGCRTEEEAKELTNGKQVRGGGRRFESRFRERIR